VSIDGRLLGGLLAAVIATSGLACRALEKAVVKGATGDIPGLTEAEVEKLKKKHPGDRPAGTTSRLQATPSPLAFGDVVVGAEGRQMVVISNPSEFAVTILSAAVQGSGFAIVSPLKDRSVIPGHGELAFTLTFRPVVQGACSGALLIEIDSAVSRFAQVTLKGQGI
jgi:hypothetical protein